MLNFKRLNNIFGWITFAIAAAVYTLTLEPSVSFWDCGEFISAAYKLQVVHPPGAPMFLIVVRLFTMLASDPSQVAWFANWSTALCSAFTILFLFWTITALAKKLITRNDAELSMPQIIAIIGSGLVGALAYTFSDTFWFSAVETEVYAMSSLCTAIVFWAILKWDNHANEPYADRWLVLIALIIGMSIGVQLLGLLAIPAITFVYYFRRYETTRKGIIYTSLVAVVLLGFIQAGIIPGIVSLAGKFDLLFVNGMGLPFGTGALFFGLLLIAATVYAILYTIRKRKVLWNTVLLCFVAMVIGYSTYAIIVIRAKADPNINMYANDDIFNLLSYLNREQYGETPLLKGQYFTAKVVDEEEGSMQYRKGKTRYEEKGRKISAVYDKTQSSIFPRIWSDNPSHVSFYKDWLDMPATRKKPDFVSDNLRFFFTYQLGHMYFRYFMWNFAGRQNDVQGHGNYTDGNWISGIKFIDEARLGSQDNLPRSIKENKAHNKLYFLPLILGLIGLFYHYKKNMKDATVVMMLFFFTGIAIVIYLNQYPYQPRERDYAYVGSFYAFAIWIGLGVLAIYDKLNNRFNKTAVAAGTTVLCLLAVPVLMAAEEWDDHDRSNKYTARDLAADYLNSCAPNAILFTMGDNDTYPLWYAQEVEGIRTDIRIVNLSLLGMDWYINQMREKTLEGGLPVPFTIPEEKYVQGTRDYIPYYDMSLEGFTDLKQVLAFVTSDNKQAQLQTRSGKYINALPTKKLRLPIDKAQVLKTGTVRPEMAERIVPAIEWELNRRALVKNDLMVLDLLANNNWERPIYFAVTIGSDNFYGLDDYLQLEGLTYRLVPVKLGNTVEKVNVDVMYENVMKKFVWGNMNKDIYLDPETTRMTMSLRNTFYQLADALLEQGKKDSCLAVLDKSMEVLPSQVIPTSYSLFSFRIAEAYYRAGAPGKANQIINNLAETVEGDLAYYGSLKPSKMAVQRDDIQQCVAVLQELARMTGANNQPELSKKLMDKTKEAQQQFGPALQR